MDRIDKITVIVIEKPFAKPLQNAVGNWRRKWNWGSCVF